MDYEPAKDDDNIEDFRNIPPPVFTSRQAAFEYKYTYTYIPTMIRSNYAIKS